MIAFFEDVTFDGKVIKKSYTGLESSKLFDELIEMKNNFLSLEENENELNKEISLCRTLDKYQLKMLINHHCNETYQKIIYNRSHNKFILKNKINNQSNKQLFDYDLLMVLTSNGICTLNLNNNRQSTFKIIK